MAESIAAHFENGFSHGLLEPLISEERAHAISVERALASNPAAVADLTEWEALHDLMRSYNESTAAHVEAEFPATSGEPVMLGGAAA